MRQPNEVCKRVETREVLLEKYCSFV